MSGLYPGMHYVVMARGREKGRDWVPISLPQNMRYDAWYYPSHPYAPGFEPVLTKKDDDTSYFSLDVEIFVTCPKVQNYALNGSASDGSYVLPEIQQDFTFTSDSQHAKVRQ